MLEAALTLLAEGRSVFPVRVERTPTGWSKTPMSARPMERAFSASELAALWPAEANGIGLELGRVSRCLRLDAEGPVPWGELGDKPDRGEFRTPSGGQGWLLEYVDGVKTDTIWKGSERHQELRLMSDGTYTVVPPSEGYSWVTPGVARLPTWLLDRQAGIVLEELTAELRPTTREPSQAEVVQALEFLPADDYHDWVQVGMALKASGHDLSVWEEWSKKGASYEEGVCANKWVTFNKVGRVRTARSILYMAEKHGFVPTDRHEPITDVGNARILARIGAGRIAHSSEWGWLAYTGGCWRQRGDAEKVVQELQKEVLRVRMEAAVKSLAKHLNSDRSADDFNAKLARKQKTIGLIRKHEDSRSIQGARELAASEPALSADYRCFDQLPYVLNCVNGSLDLRDGELRPHNPEDRLTQLCPTEYNPQAGCLRWVRFMEEVFEGDQERIHWMRKLLGYCLTGLTTHHILPLWLGGGRNGKSTMAWAMIHVLGPDYASTAPQDFLRNSPAARHPTEIADLYGKRFVVDLETDANMYLNESRVKRLTGGDQLKARRMGEDFWAFTPTHKLIVASNNEPNIRFMDPALKARIRKVPFDVSFEGREDFSLKDTLAAEASGILTWLVGGAQLFLVEGLKDPPSIRSATEEYQDEQNTVKQFVEQMLVKEGKTRVGTIAAAYRAWCLQNSVAKPVEGKQLWNMLREQGIGKDKNDAFCSIRKD